MSQPRDASYSKYDGCERLGEDVSISKNQNETNCNYNPSCFRSMPTEFRGITLRQLRAIIPLIKRRCKKEKWTRPVYKNGEETEEVERVTFESATLYDVNKYIIKPFTKYSQKSFVETMPSTKGTQPPHWFVSHYWGESFVHTMACLEQMVKDLSRPYTLEGGMTEDTPVWICAFANNQHDLKFDMTVDPADSSFAKAMKIANFCVISILDVQNEVYTRLWCMYELYLTLLLSKEQGVDGLLAVYTHHECKYRNGHKTVHRSAVALINDNVGFINDYVESEEHFPKEHLLKSLSVSIQDAKASRDDDHKHILNAIAGRRGDDIELDPLKDHENYEIFNNAVRGVFASTQIGIRIAYDDGKKEHWHESLHAIKHSVTRSMNLGPYLNDIEVENVVDLFHHLPIGLQKLGIHCCLHGRVAMDAFLDWLENTSTNLKELVIFCTWIGGKVGGKECGDRLARFLARDDCKIEKLTLRHTDLVGSRNVDTWIKCLEKNQSLKDVRFSGMAYFVKYVEECEHPNTSIDVPFLKGKILWDGNAFPDATLSIEQEQALTDSLPGYWDNIKPFEEEALRKPLLGTEYVFRAHYFALHEWLFDLPDYVALPFIFQDRY